MLVGAQHSRRREAQRSLRTAVTKAKWIEQRSRGLASVPAQLAASAGSAPLSARSARPTSPSPVLYFPSTASNSGSNCRTAAEMSETSFDAFVDRFGRSREMLTVAG